jgi:hypothetical protein
MVDYLPSLVAKNPDGSVRKKEPFEMIIEKNHFSQIDRLTEGNKEELAQVLKRIDNVAFSLMIFFALIFYKQPSFKGFPEVREQN